MIEYMLWSDNDSHLVTGSLSGTIYVWNSLTWEKHFEHYPTSKKIKTLSLGFDEELDMLIYSTDDSRIRMVYGLTNDSIVDCWLEKYCITSILINKKKKILFAGTSRGSIGNRINVLI
jgi:WD40 repeat protein